MPRGLCVLVLIVFGATACSMSSDALAQTAPNELSSASLGRGCKATVQP